MHVLALTQHDILVPRYGGALRDSMLLKRLLAYDHRVNVIRFRLATEAPSLPDPNLPVYDVIVPDSYPIAPIAALTHLLSSQATRLALDLNEKYYVDLIQSDPPWAALTGARVANRLRVPHVILSQNCESKLAAQIAKATLAWRIPVVGRLISGFNVAVLQWAEKRAIANANLSLTPSVRDRQEMESCGIPTSRVEITPNGTSTFELSRTARARVRHRLRLDTAPIVIFAGRLDYPPNTEAARTICEAIAPQCPRIIFILVGLNPPQIKLPPNVRALGYVDDINIYFNSSDLSIVPITFGSGTRLKILDAWSAGVPVVSTSIAASGLEYEDGVNIVIENDLKRFPQRIQELLDSCSYLAKLRLGALQAAKPYHWDVIGRQYVKRLEALVRQS
jgi:glycosyltransferase involved in cell wall biosynthesis